MTVARRPQALLFDVFGTVVDWRGSIAREVRKLVRARGSPASIDGGAFADRWRAGYVPAMQRVRSGELAWQSIDDLNRTILDTVLPEFALRLPERDKRALNLVWHRLSPWSDAVAGLARLKRRHIVGTLSNGNVKLLVDMAKNARLPWDCVLSAELFRHYKPDPEVYLGAAALLDLAPREVMLVAAHKEDLAAARRCGMRTAFVRRPLENGAGVAADVDDDPRCTFNADDVLDLARQLSC
ncbi:MAG: haloacid dehalogenase type II [Betaproteobacteria bacterium]